MLWFWVTVLPQNVSSKSSYNGWLGNNYSKYHSMLAPLRLFYWVQNIRLAGNMHKTRCMLFGSESTELNIREGCFIYSELPLAFVTAHRVYHNICFIPDPNGSWDKYVRKSWISAQRAPPPSPHSALACLYSVTLTRHQSAPQKKKLFPIQFFTSCLGKVIILWCLAAPCVTNGASLSMCVIAGVRLLLGTRRVG